MSTSPEDPGQGGSSQQQTGESSGHTNGLYHPPPGFNSIEDDEEDPANGDTTNGDTTNGASQQGGQDNHGYNVADNEGADSDVKNTGPHSAIRYNTPASTESTPAPVPVPGPSPAHIATAVAALAQRRSGTRWNDELSKVSSVGSPGTTSDAPSPPPPPPPQPSLPPAQFSPASAGSNPHHPIGQGSPAGQAENTGTGAHQSGPSSSSSGTPGLTSHQGSQIDTQGQNRSGETLGADNSQNESIGENEAAAEHDQPPAISQQSNLLNQQTSRGIPSLDGASDWDGGETTMNPSARQGGYHLQHQGPAHASSSSTQLAFSHGLRRSQLPGAATAPGPSAAQSSGSSSMNPIAPSFVPRPRQSDAPQSVTLPTWQADNEVTHCPICGVRFTMFLRRHHCRKCGRVVCDGCSPHRITIPHPYIVRPPGDPGPALQYAYPGVERGIANFSSIGGGERVRLCNPCVPDPNTAPPQPQQPSRPIVVDGRASHARPPNEPFGNYSADARPYPQHPQLRSQVYTSSRNRSATTSTGHAQEHFSYFPYSSASNQYQRSNAAAYAYYTQASMHHRRVSSSGVTLPPTIDLYGRLHGSSSSGFAPSLSGLNRPLPSIPTPEREIPEEDACPVCHRELPSRSLSNCEALREAHINNCITTHSNYRGNQTMITPGAGNHGTPPPRTTRRTRMFPYVATEKDCVGDVECTICLEEFKVGDQMARLECFCRFHRSCIDSWFVNHPGRCPIHQHDSFGY